MIGIVVVVRVYFVVVKEMRSAMWTTWCVQMNGKEQKQGTNDNDDLSKESVQTTKGGWGFSL